MECRDIDTRQRPLAGESDDFLAELLDLEESFLALFSDSSNAHEVLEQLGACFLLEKERKLNGAVKEASDDLDVLLLHVT